MTTRRGSAFARRDVMLILCLLAGCSGDGASGGNGGGGGTTSPPSSRIPGATFYLSPLGNDGADGRATGSAWKTFVHAFSTMQGGDELILIDGVYSEAAGTGHISYLGANSAQIPSGTDSSHTTYVRALHPGSVKILGGLFIGRSFRKDGFIVVDGITFDSGTSDSAADLYNTHHVAIKNCGFHSESQSAGAVVNVGTNDNNVTNDEVLLQDIWAWGKERIGLLIYRSDHVVVRRAVVRQDGCDDHANGCGNNSGNYIVGTTVYNSFDVSFQNVIVVDSVLGSGGYAGAGDFYTAWHDNYVYPWYGNEWLGTISLNSELSSGYGYDLDSLAAPQQPMATYKNIVAWNDAYPFDAQENGCGGNCAAHNIVIANATLKAIAGNGLRISDNMASGNHDVKNVVVLGAGDYGVNSVATPNYMDVSGAWSQGTYNRTPCATGCLTLDPIGSGALKYPTRIEGGSALSGQGANGEDIGANVVYRYGADDSFWGDAGYNALTAEPLWPWPNQARIRAEMCATTTRGFCAATSLSSYIWGAAGGASPY